MKWFNYFNHHITCSFPHCKNCLCVFLGKHWLMYKDGEAVVWCVRITVTDHLLTVLNGKGCNWYFRNDYYDMEHLSGKYMYYTTAEVAQEETFLWWWPHTLPNCNSLKNDHQFKQRHWICQISLHVTRVKYCSYNKELY